MNLASVFFPPADLRRDAFFASSQPMLIAAYRADCYEHKGEVPVGELLGEDAAEEAFDLTNNPSRQNERDACWSTRSVSVGDIILMGNVAYLCASSGWVEIN